MTSLSSSSYPELLHVKYLVIIKEMTLNFYSVKKQRYGPLITPLWAYPASCFRLINRLHFSTKVPLCAPLSET